MQNEKQNALLGAMIGLIRADIETLLNLHDEGVKEGREALGKILTRFGKE